MSIETEVATLTTATDSLAANVETNKATLDTAASNAKTSADAALTSLATAEGYVVETENFLDQAYNSVQSAASAVAYQDLAALAESKVNSAVSVFVYDTSRDSDGGAWRHRCGHTSWYNEPLNTDKRGARREFPAVAVIVGEANFLTIFDGDDPSLPMWMVFNRGNNNWLRLGAAPNALAAKNGIICAGSSGLDLVAINFIKEFNGFYAAQFYTTTGDISQRNAGLSFTIIGGANIVDRAVNDIAMTVLPDAPIDSATGLPTPTIAVATNGGVSVIKDDGTVVDSDYNGISNVCFFEDKGLWFGDVDGAAQLLFATLGDINAGDGFGDVLANTILTQEFDLLAKPDNLAFTQDVLVIGGKNRGGSSVEGLALRQPDYSDQTKGMSSLITTTYNTGWMHGDIKGAWLSDTTAETVGVDEASELVTNGTFDTDLSGWTSLVNATWVSGEINCANGQFIQSSLFTGSKTVRLTWDQTINSGTRCRVRLRNAAGSGDVGLFSYYTGTGPQSVEFSTSDGLSLWFFVESGHDVTFDNISVKETGELVVNGTFDYGLSSWAVNNPGTGVGWVWDNGVAKVSSTADGRNLSQAMMTVGESYIVTFNKQGTGTLDLYYNGASAYKRVSEATVGDISFYLKNVTSETITFFCGEVGVSVDNVSVRLAEPDRSVNNNGLQVYGQITKTPVATGADLVGYGPFAPTNYFAQPYNPDLDFGTGDFYVMGWYQAVDATTYGMLFSRGSSTSVDTFIYNNNGPLQVSIGNGGTETIGVTFTDNTDYHIVVTRKSGVAYVYVNGNLAHTFANTANLTDVGAVLVFGGRFNHTTSLGSGKLALWRIGAGAPSAEQIKKIYEDEKVLFQEGAQATLYGSSNAVTALAHDPVTDLLHVGTSAGRSDFKGLRRINNTTTAVGSTISASGGLIVED
jgi:hypothetical protein